MRVDADQAALVVIDVQEAFRKGVPNFDEVARGSGILVQAARETGVPVVVTQQYPSGLGATVPEVADHLPEEARPIDKVAVLTSVETVLFELVREAGTPEFKKLQGLVK